LQVQLCVHRDVTLEVSRAEVDALHALLPGDRVEDVHTDLDIRSRHADQVQSATDSEHCEALLGDRFLPHEVENMVGSSRQKITGDFNRFRLAGVDYVGGAESSGLIKSLRLDVDDDDPRCSSNTRSTNGVEPNSSGAEDHDRVAGGNVGRVQDRSGAGYDSASEQRSLGERKLLGYEGQLVLVDERPFSEAAQPEALEQANPIAA